MTKIVSILEAKEGSEKLESLLRDLTESCKEFSPVIRMWALFSVLGHYLSGCRSFQEYEAILDDIVKDLKEKATAHYGEK